MDDFLSGREVLSRNGGAARTSASASTLPPLGRPEPREEAPSGPEAGEVTGEHGTRVETVVERGRVTRLIVTCTCGNVTEIECRY